MYIPPQQGAMGATQQCVCVKLTSMCSASGRMPHKPSHASAVQPVCAAAERAERATRVGLTSGAERGRALAAWMLAATKAH